MTPLFRRTKHVVNGSTTEQPDPTAEPITSRAASYRLTRREAISSVALVGVGAGIDHIASRADHTTSQLPSVRPPGHAIAFYGEHQAGVATSAQEYLHFASFDLTTMAVSDVQSLLQRWTAAAARLCAGESYRPSREEPSQPPVETGEAVGLGPSRLTFTFGFGPSIFARLGLGRLRPHELAPLPPFAGDALEAGSSGGDLCVQACADDPQVAFHAVHLLSRIANGVAVLRWAQQGFGRTSSTSRTQTTPRNLMGFKDGTDNIRAEDAGAMDAFVWVSAADGPPWMVGGTYLVARRIQILFDVWDSTSLEGQERTIGRKKLSGAPLEAESEYSPVDLTALNSSDEPLIPRDAHIRLASPVNNDGQRILRRGYSYGQGVEGATGEIDAGLFFIAFQRSPRRQFIPLQRRLATSDALNHHTRHTASAIFACPPGAGPGGFIGDSLFS